MVKPLSEGPNEKLRFLLHHVGPRYLTLSGSCCLQSCDKGKIEFRICSLWSLSLIHEFMPPRQSTHLYYENVPTLIAPWEPAHLFCISFITPGVSDVHFH